VEKWTLLRPLVRRPTAGGLVPHDADWTYSLVFPPSHWWFQFRAEESYRRLHEWLADAFSRLQLSAELASGPAKTAPGQCFAGPEKFDLLWRGTKIAGAAQRRTRDGMLIQGSIQPLPPGLARAAWEKAMCAGAEAAFSVRWVELKPDASLHALAARLATEKYSQREFNQRR
jgi:lipoate-protein ligase A